MARAKRSFSVDFREKAVAYVLEQNKSIAVAARELGIGESTLGNWVSAARRADPDSKGSMDREEREEVRRLRAENRELQMRVELLKKRRPSSRTRHRTDLLLHRRGEGHIPSQVHVRRAGRVPPGLLRLAGPPSGAG